MSSKVDHSSELPISTGIARKSRRSTTFIRVFKYLALCSATLTLSTVLPWPLLQLQSRVTNIPLKTTFNDPASEWKDDIWPIRPPAAWDISTDFPFPRTLEYNVQQGTWLRLDVHPKSGDIVFDMIGDLYCLSAADVAKGGVTKARPILLGVPHDSDPHFSPEGDRVVFRSDAELGIENIWIMTWKGCEAMDVRAVENLNDELRRALLAKDVENQLLVDGVKEDAERKYNRLLREGRHGGKFIQRKSLHGN